MRGQEREVQQCRQEELGGRRRMKEGILASSCETETEYTAGCTVTKCFGEGLVSLSPLSLTLSLSLSLSLSGDKDKTASGISVSSRGAH